MKNQKLKQKPLTTHHHHSSLSPKHVRKVTINGKVPENHVSKMKAQKVTKKVENHLSYRSTNENKQSKVANLQQKNLNVAEKNIKN